MAWILLDSGATPPKKSGDLDQANMVYCEGDVPTTYRARVAKKHRQAHAAQHRAWTTALRAARDFWQQQSQAERDIYIAASVAADGARPDMDKAPANGWTLWAELALAFFKHGRAPNTMTEYDDLYVADCLTFTRANVTTQKLEFTFDFSAHPTAGYGSTIFFHQYDPAYAYAPADNRHTRICGFYVTVSRPPDPVVVTFDAQWPLYTSDPTAYTRAMIRYHQGKYGAVNLVQDALTY